MLANSIPRFIELNGMRRQAGPTRSCVDVSKQSRTAEAAAAC